MKKCPIRKYNTANTTKTIVFAKKHIRRERERPKEQEEMGTNELAATTNNNLDDSIWRTKKVTDGGECKIKIKM